MLEKKQLKGVKNKERAWEIIKKEALNLVKYRHPKILNIVESIIEDKYSMGFVTERVESNL